jgi:hypothetical protein
MQNLRSTPTSVQKQSETFGTGEAGKMRHHVFDFYETIAFRSEPKYEFSLDYTNVVKKN